MISQSLHQGLHLARRFAGSLSSEPPRPADEEWALAQLRPGEELLWERLSNPDRRHAAAVARAVDAALDRAGLDLVGESRREVLAAALLHDVGKIASGLGTWRRVAATLIWAAADLRADHERPRRWTHSRFGPFRRLGQYRLHPELGAALLIGAGAAPLTAAWTREHHQPPDRWSAPAPVARILKDCDDD